MSNLVSIIIVNWNGKEHLQKCLPSVYKQAYKRVEVILVDNGSVDGSVEWVKKHFMKTKIIVNKENLGFAQANNIGYRKSKGDYVLFLNNDTLVTKDFLVELLKAFGDKSVGGVQSKIFLMDTPKLLDSAGSFLTNTGFLYHTGIHAEDSAGFGRAKEIYSAKGACMMFKREVLEQIKVSGGIFDERYFAYFEETDMCHRVWLAGYRIVFVPSSVIYHKFGATSGRLQKPFIEYHSYKNRINSYIKNLGVRELLKILTLHLLLCEILSVMFLLRGTPRVALAIQKAIFWNLTNLRTTLRKRSIVQTKIRKLKDDIILPRIRFDVGPSYYLYHFVRWKPPQINVKTKI